jgi:glycosyltransferase involved in cell wall biosynthesis
VTHGTLEKRYGVQTMIKSINIVKETYPDVKFYIIGKGEYSGNLKSLAKDLNLYGKNVIFIDYMDIKEIAKYLNRANLGIFHLRKTYIQIL